MIRTVGSYAGSDMKKEKAHELPAEKIITVGLRKGWLKVPKNERGKRAVAELRERLMQSLNIDSIKISVRVNQALWKRGMQHPPSTIRVKVTHEEDGVVVRLPEELVIKKEEKKPKKLLETAKGIAKVPETSKKTEKVGKEVKAAEKAGEKSGMHTEQPSRESPQKEQVAKEKETEKPKEA